MEKKRQSLIHERDSLRRNLVLLKENEKKGLKESVKVLSLYGDEHLGDLGSTTFEREMDRSLIMDMEDELSQIEEALSHLKKGEYGICKTCGMPISSMRLEARPQAIYCKDCQKRHEREQED